MPDTTATEPSSPTGTVSPSGNELAAVVAELQARITGFQTALNRKTQEFTEASTAREALAVKLAEESAKSANLTTERDRLTMEAATTRDNLERYKVIASKGLVADEEQGLLRQDLKGAEFSNYLETFAARMQAAVGQAPSPVNKTAATAPAVGATRQGAAATRDILFSQIGQATKANDMAAFDVAYDQLLAASRLK